MPYKEPVTSIIIRKEVFKELVEYKDEDVSWEKFLLGVTRAALKHEQG